MTTDTGQTFPGVHEAIIAPELFDQAEAVRTGRRRKVKVKHDYLFRGVFQCAHCDRALVGELQKGNVYYRCHQKDCPARTIREDIVDDALRKHLNGIQFSPDDLAHVRQKFVAWIETNDKTALAKQAPLEISAIKERLSRLTDKFIDDLIDHATYEQKKISLLKEQKKWETIERSSRDKAWHVAKIDELLERVKNLCEHYEFGDPARKREVIRFACSNFQIGTENPELKPPKWHSELQFALSDHQCAPAADPTRTISELNTALEQSKTVRMTKPRWRSQVLCNHNFAFDGRPVWRKPPNSGSQIGRV